MYYQSKSINCISNSILSSTPKFQTEQQNTYKNPYFEKFQDPPQKKIYFSSTNKDINDKTVKAVFMERSKFKPYNNTYSNGFKFEPQKKLTFPTVKPTNNSSTQKDFLNTSSVQSNKFPKSQIDSLIKFNKLLSSNNGQSPKTKKYSRNASNINKQKASEQLKDMVKTAYNMKNREKKVQKMNTSIIDNKSTNGINKRNKIDCNNILFQNNLRIQFQNMKNNIEDLMEYYNRKVGSRNSNDKVFILNSQDDYIRRVLLNWGWVQNKIIDSPFFNLKWSYTDNIQVNQYSRLLNGQYFNHFKNNQQLTSKGRLLKNLKNNPNSTSLPAKYFFPKCFDLGNAIQIDQFNIEYQRTCLFIILRKHYRYFQMKIDSEQFKRIENTIIKRQNLKQQGSYYKKEYKIQRQFTKFQLFEYQDYQNPKNDFIVHINLIVIALKYYRYLKKKYCQNQQHLKRNKKTKNYILNFKKDQFNQNIEFLVKYSRMSIPFLPNEQKLFTKQYFSTPSQKLIKKIIKYYHFFNKIYQKEWKVQGQQNIWVIKPANNSKGNGIYLHKDRQQIISSSQGIGDRIVQKYIEQPLIIKQSPYGFLNNRKFDIRQWVLVTSYNPLMIRSFSSCYIRICSQTYDISQIKSLQKHLTNYTFNKNNFSNKQQSVLSLQCLKELLNQNYQISWDQQIKPKINNLIIDAIKCCSENLQPNPHCFQMYGFDILIDKQFNPWLLQVNLSPACEQRCSFIKQYCQVMSEKMLRIILPSTYFNQNNWLNPNHQKYQWEIILQEKCQYIQKNNKQMDNLQIVGTSFNVKKQRIHYKKYLQYKAALKIQSTYRMIRQMRNYRKVKRMIIVKKLQHYLRYFKYDLEYKNRKKDILIKPILQRFFRTSVCLYQFKQKKGIEIIRSHIQNNLKIALQTNKQNQIYKKLKKNQAIKVIQFFYCLKKKITEIKNRQKFFKSVVTIQKFYKLRYKILNKKAKIITKAIKYYAYNLRQKKFIHSIIKFSQTKVLAKFIYSFSYSLFLNKKIKSKSIQTINNYIKSFNCDILFNKIRQESRRKNLNEFGFNLQRICRVLKRRTRIYYFPWIQKYGIQKQKSKNNIERYILNLVLYMNEYRKMKQKKQKLINKYIGCFLDELRYGKFYMEYKMTEQQQQRTRIGKQNSLKFESLNKLNTQQISDIDCIIQFKRSLEPEIKEYIKPQKFDRYIDFVAKSNQFLQKRKLERQVSRKKKFKKVKEIFNKL